jgi:uncharacterized Fe-S center protein
VADVFLYRLDDDASAELAPPDLGRPLAELTGRLGLDTGRDAGTWALKVEAGPQGRRPRIDPRWAEAVAGRLGGPRGAFCCDTLSITTRTLEDPAVHLDTARAKGFGSHAEGLPYLVADGPDQGASRPLTLPGHGLTVGLAAGVAAADGLCILNSLRPHPHLGFQGAVAALGLGTVDRTAKIDLHRDIRPSVDTPLCAGCGSCLDVCLFDAIVISAGRAHIDHEKCTGCGECMTVCFMAGIESEEAAGIARFQEGVAETAALVRGQVGAGAAGRFGCFNFLVGLGERGSGARARRAKRPGTIGVLAGTDPVAVDQAAWDLVGEKIDGPLHEWAGYRREPEALLARAVALGLGRRDYRLVEIR